MSKSFIFFFLLLAFVAGIALASFVFIPVSVIWAGGVIGLVVAASGILRKQKTVGIYGFLFLVFLGGALRFEMSANAEPDLSKFYGNSVDVEGFIDRDPEYSAAAQRLTVVVEKIDGERAGSFYTLVTVRKYPEYKIGDELFLRGPLERPESYGEFDYVGYLGRENIFSVMPFPLVQKIGNGRGNMLSLILSRIKHAFEENIDRTFSEPHAAFLKGLTLGERESLPAGLVENFKRTGTTHIVALSGYNITLVGRFFMALFLFLTLPFQAAFWVASTAIFLFVLLTGASPSVVRAGIMGILVLIAQKEGRLYNMRNALALAGALMIFHNPKILRFDAAFQLSFLATVGLIYFSPHVDAFLNKALYRTRLFLGFHRKLLTEAEKAEIARKKRKSLFQFRQILVETLAAQIMVLPLLIYLFGRVSLISPVSNLLVLIAVPWSMVLGFITGGLGFIWQPLADVSGWVTWAFLEYKMRVIDLFAALPFISAEVGQWAIAPLLAAYAWIFWKIRKKKGA